MNECGIEGCPKPEYYKHALCVMHYRRQQRGVDLYAPEERRGLCLTERLWQHIDVRDWSECWEWQKGRNDQGYGQFHDDQHRTVMAHRIAYETYWRVSLEKWGLHNCNNPPCCNPLHVYDGTPTQNQMDSIDAGTRKEWGRARGEASGRSKLLEEDVREIRQKYASGTSQRQLAEKYGVSQSAISRIAREVWWRHVE